MSTERAALADSVLRDVIQALWTLPGFAHNPGNSIAQDVWGYGQRLLRAEESEGEHDARIEVLKIVRRYGVDSRAYAAGYDITPPTLGEVVDEIMAVAARKERNRATAALRSTETGGEHGE